MDVVVRHRCLFKTEGEIRIMQDEIGDTERMIKYLDTRHKCGKTLITQMIINSGQAPYVRYFLLTEQKRTKTECSYFHDLS